MGASGLSQIGGASAKERETITIEQWRDRASELLGEPFDTGFMRLTFVCPACGNVASMAEFKAAGASEPSAAAQNCIGRFSLDKGCDWAAYGLFDICTLHVDFLDGKKPTPVFEFGAPEPRDVFTCIHEALAAEIGRGIR
jgi:hypothetical protein